MLFARIEALNDQEDPGFGGGDHLLLWAWRRIAFGQADCPLLAREFLDAFGEDGADALATLQVFLHAIGAASRYRLTLGMPGGFTLTRDEERVLTLLAAAQAGDAPLVEHHLDLLVRDELRHVVAITAHALAKAFALGGLHLSRPATRMKRGCPQQALAG